MWRGAHREYPIFLTGYTLRTGDTQRMENLLEIGYVMWDLLVSGDESSWHMRLDQACEGGRYDEVPKFSNEIKKDSENRRMEVYGEGGRGYWPLKGIDFSRVQWKDEKNNEQVVRDWWELTSEHWYHQHRVPMCHKSKEVG